MPELAEVRLMGDFVRSCLRTPCVAVRFADREKLARFDLSGQLDVESRGKELRFTDGDVSVLFGMGMTGNWYRARASDDWAKHDRLAFSMADGHEVRLTDPRRFARWSVVPGVGWSPNRGPCPLTEHEAFVVHVFDKWRGARGRKPMHEVMLDQSLFNGIGNYLRAEILGHASVDPMIPLHQLDVDELSTVLTLCHTVPLRFYHSNGGRIRTFRDPSDDAYRGRSTFDFYQNTQRCVPMKDRGGRTFWMVRERYNFYFS